MPYIAPELRRELDPLIDALAERLASQSKAAGSDGAFTGLLNYACTRLALALIRRRFGRLRYWLIAAVTGVFHNVAAELYRRVAVPYEDVQRPRAGMWTCLRNLPGTWRSNKPGKRDYMGRGDVACLSPQTFTLIP